MKLVQNKQIIMQHYSLYSHIDKRGHIAGILDPEQPVITGMCGPYACMSFEFTKTLLLHIAVF